jgi:hypothetical protein
MAMNSSGEEATRGQMYDMWEAQQERPRTTSSWASSRTPASPTDMAEQVANLTALVERLQEQLRHGTQSRLPTATPDLAQLRTQRIMDIDTELADLDRRRSQLLEERRSLDPTGYRMPSVAFRGEPEGHLSPAQGGIGNGHDVRGRMPVGRENTPYDLRYGDGGLGFAERGRQRIKIPEPKKFEGTIDPAIFKSFRIDVETYLNAQDFGGDYRLRRQTFRLLLGDKIKTWFDSQVPLIYDWDDDQLFEALYQYCIPATSLDAVYDKYKSCRQRGRRIQEFATELSTLRTQIGIDRVTEWQMKRDFIRGLDKATWSKIYGEYSDDTPWEELVRRATREDETVRPGGLLGVSQGNSTAQGGNIRFDQSRAPMPKGFGGNSAVNNRSGPGSPATTGNHSNAATTGNHSNAATNKPRGPTDNRGLPGPRTDQDKAQQRARDEQQGNCFLCHRAGHRSADCPQRRAIDMKAQVRAIHAECAAMMQEDEDSVDDISRSTNEEEDEFTEGQGNDLGA